MERRGLYVGLLLSLLCGALLAGPLMRREEPGAARAALVGTVGLGSLSLPSGTVWGRDLSDGLLVPLSDTPGAYCLHPICDTVGPPRASVYTMKILR